MVWRWLPSGSSVPNNPSARSSNAGPDRPAAPGLRHRPAGPLLRQRPRADPACVQGGQLLEIRLARLVQGMVDALADGGVDRQPPQLAPFDPATFGGLIRPGREPTADDAATQADVDRLPYFCDLLAGMKGDQVTGVAEHPDQTGDLDLDTDLLPALPHR